MASFSSRGPNRAIDTIVPAVNAPGVDILAAFGVDDPDPPIHGFISGTSMASPHVAGAGALLTQARPDWSPAQQQSALMTTAVPTVLNHDGAAGDALPAGLGARRRRRAPRRPACSSTRASPTTWRPTPTRAAIRRRSTCRRSPTPNASSSARGSARRRCRSTPRRRSRPASPGRRRPRPTPASPSTSTLTPATVSPGDSMAISVTADVERLGRGRDPVRPDHADARATPPSPR